MGNGSHYGRRRNAKIEIKERIRGGKCNRRYIERYIERSGRRIEPEYLKVRYNKGRDQSIIATFRCRNKENRNKY